MFSNHANDTPNETGNALLHINCGRHWFAGLLVKRSCRPAWIIAFTHCASFHPRVEHSHIPILLLI